MKNENNEPSKAEEAKPSRPNPPYNYRDCWGPVCSRCPWIDHPHKPCAVCEKARAG